MSKPRSLRLTDTCSVPGCQRVWYEAQGLGPADERRCRDHARDLNWRKQDRYRNERHVITIQRADVLEL